MTDSPEFHGAAPWLACSNLTETVDHYRNVLGFHGDWHWFWGEPPDHAGVSRDKTRILFVKSPAKAKRCRGSEVVVYVRHVAALYEELQGSGANIVREYGERPWGTLDFTVEDPDGVCLIFTEAPEYVVE